VQWEQWVQRKRGPTRAMARWLAGWRAGWLHRWLWVGDQLQCRGREAVRPRGP
jgi:hypothetical protein